MTKTIAFLTGLVILIVVGLSSIFIVDERESALVLQFGQIKQVKTEPGLGFKVPFIQDVQKYDTRIQSLDTDPLEVTPLDDRRLVVDAFARWRISDVVQFRQAVGVGGLFQAESRLDQILRTNLREVLGSVNSNDILSVDRVQLMNRIREAAAAEARSIGIDVVDVRMKRTDLPQANLQATYERMRAEREREARDERARGQEAAQRVRAQADRTATELVSEAQREAEIIRGEADAERNGIFAAAFGRDPEFFAFYRSLSAYEQAIRGSNSTMVMSPDSEFFEYFNSDAGRGGDLALPPAAQPNAALIQGGDGSEEAAAERSDPTVRQELQEIIDDVPRAEPGSADLEGLMPPDPLPEGEASGEEPDADTGDSDGAAGDTAPQDEATEPAE